MIQRIYSFVENHLGSSKGLFLFWGKMKNEITHEIKFLGQISIKVE